MSFYLTKVNFQGREVPLWKEISCDDFSSNRYTILIGRNGLGKSRMLAEICRIFKKFDEAKGVIFEDDYRTISLERNKKSSLTWSELEFIVDKRRVTIPYNNGKIWNIKVEGNTVHGYNEISLPNKVIAITVSPFDKFPIDKYNYAESNKVKSINERKYNYMGSKDSFGRISTKGMLKKVIESLVAATAGNYKRDGRESKLLNVFNLLEYDKTLILEYTLKRNITEIYEFYTAFNRGEDSELINHAKNIVQSRSFTSYKYRNILLEDEKLILKLIDSLKLVGRYINENSRIIILELNLEIGTFTNGSIEVFEGIKFLQSVGIISLGDLYLFKTDLGNDPIRLSDASSGEQSTILTFLGIASEIEDNSLIIIDEPEISLHPDWQEKFIHTLAKTFSVYKGCHFILATHSPLILAQASDINGVFVTMDNMAIEILADYTKRSADFQLATAFSTPGFKNEYLARESLTALQLASHGEFDNPEFKEKLALLSGLRAKLDDSDPIAQITDALILAYNNQGK